MFLFKLIVRNDLLIYPKSTFIILYQKIFGDLKITVKLFNNKGIPHSTHKIKEDLKKISIICF